MPTYLPTYIHTGGVSVDKIVQTPELREMASRVMMDVIKAANVELAKSSANDAATARKAFANNEVGWLVGR